MLKRTQYFESGAANTMDLLGAWRFSLDPDDMGTEEAWYDKELKESIVLPASLPVLGIGNPVTVGTVWMGKIVDDAFFKDPAFEPYRQPGNIKLPFWLTPDTHYTGTAWYQRDVEIPASWKGRRAELSLERAHWQTQVWVDDRAVGANASLGTAHVYNLGALVPGRHRLSIRVDNRLIVNVGWNAHSISDHTQGNWNGLIGHLELRSRPLVWIEDLQVYPVVASKSVKIRGRLGNDTGAAGAGQLAFEVEAGESAGELRAKPVVIAVGWDAKGGAFEAELILGANAELWDEFHPALYSLKAVLDNGNDEARTVFGLREIGTEGPQFTLNGRKIFFRGTLECCIFPKTGHPPMDVESWKRIINIARAHGLNHMRFHSWCPPEAAFIAADQLGFYYQVECSAWTSPPSVAGTGTSLDPWLYEEADRMLKSYGNHPSFVLMTHGNEPHDGKESKDYLSAWLTHYKAADPRRLCTSGAGWPALPESQFHDLIEPRVQGWGEELKSRINARAPETVTDYRSFINKYQVPVISHEIGQWCAYPDFEEIAKYTGHLKAKNFEIFRDTLAAHHMAGQAKAFLQASGKLQMLCYKEDIESALRTPGMGGFQLLDLHDFPGQGTAPVGVLNAFWESKGYVTPGEYSRFCNGTVPLARLAKRVFTSDETLEAQLEAAHFGAGPMRGVTTAWKLLGEDGSKAAEGRLPAVDLPLGNGIALGNVRIELKTLKAPARYKLVVELEQTPFANDWDVWVYPPKVNTETPQGVTVVEVRGPAAQSALKGGGQVLLLIPPQLVKEDEKLGKIKVGFSSIFWNLPWTRRAGPHTLGILCDPENPALAEFPTDSHSNWQWWYLMSRASAMILDTLPPDLVPTVQAIDDWNTNRKLGFVFEAKVGKGKLLVCSIDLKKEMDGNPVARQLLSSLLAYMAGSGFDPKVVVGAEAVADLLAF